MKPTLMTVEEMVRHYKRGENLFAITIKKWERIRDSVSAVKKTGDMGPIIESARTGGAFCLEYRDNCLLCPIQPWCRNPKGTYQTAVRLMYMYAASGQRRYKEQARRHINQFLDEMREYWQESQRRLH